MATNLRNNIDEAIQSRVGETIRFSRPTIAQCKQHFAANAQPGVNECHSSDPLCLFFFWQQRHNKFPGMESLDFLWARGQMFEVGIGYWPSCPAVSSLWTFASWKQCTSWSANQMLLRRNMLGQTKWPLWIIFLQFGLFFKAENCWPDGGKLTSWSFSLGSFHIWHTTCGLWEGRWVMECLTCGGCVRSWCSCCVQPCRHCAQDCRERSARQSTVAHSLNSLLEIWVCRKMRQQPCATMQGKAKHCLNFAAWSHESVFCLTWRIWTGRHAAWEGLVRFVTHGISYRLGPKCYCLWQERGTYFVGLWSSWGHQTAELGCPLRAVLVSLMMYVRNAPRRKLISKETMLWSFCFWQS